MEGEAPCSDRCLDVSRRIEGAGSSWGFGFGQGNLGLAMVVAWVLD